MHKKIHQNKIFIVQKVKKRDARCTASGKTLSKSFNSSLLTVITKDSSCLNNYHEKELKVEIPMYHHLNTPTMETSEASNDHLFNNEEIISHNGDYSPANTFVE